MLKPLMFALVIICTSAALKAQTAGEWFAMGLESFRWQNIEEASVYFGRAAVSNPGMDEYFLYLGITHHQSGRYQNAEEAYGKGISLNGPQRDRLLLNRGNLRFSMGNTAGAASDYGLLVDGGGVLASSALLNRANMELNLASYTMALDDYTRYLTLEPDSPQRPVIEELIGLLGARLASDAEALRAAEELARAEEERRLAAEALRAEEEARRAALMAEVLQSLSGSGEETSSLSAGSENLRQDFEDSALED
jgi:tetratricopeptide (TPR) repeat protein